MNENLLDKVMSPLGPDNCYLYYGLAIFSLITTFFVILALLLSRNKYKLNMFSKVYLISAPLYGYYIHRLLYSMCIKSL